jgi:3-deoxy-D-arabino-heptulosonate 7-phosphate (DAHP) synthase class II
MTAGERQQLKNVFLRGMKLDLSTGQPKVGEIDPKILNEAENKTIELMVVSINGEKGNILSKVLNWKTEDYDYLMSEINKLTKASEEKKS